MVSNNNKKLCKTCIFATGNDIEKILSDDVVICGCGRTGKLITNEFLACSHHESRD